MRAGLKLPAGPRFATILPDMDFETYSEAGYRWDEKNKKWKSVSGQKGGIFAVGAKAYAEHPSTEVICLAYDLKDGEGQRLWIPGTPEPQDLFDHLNAMQPIEAWNASFEYHIWENVCHKRMGWPPMSHLQMRDGMAKSRAHSLPGALGKSAAALGAQEQKDKEGTRLINKFCKPRNPTKNDPRTRIRPEDDLEDAWKFYVYCLQDIATEAGVSTSIPDLLPEEEEFWLNTQAANYRGVGVRREEVESCIAILDQAYAKYNAELQGLLKDEVIPSLPRPPLNLYCPNPEMPEVVEFGGKIKASETAKILRWVNSKISPKVKTLDESSILEILSRQGLPQKVRRVLEIRKMIGSAGVKKVYAMERQMSADGRLCDMFNYHGARTGRDTGSDVQPQNLVKAGPMLRWCGSCEKPFGAHRVDCPHCGTFHVAKPEKWSWEGVEYVLEAISTKSLEYVEHVFGDAVLSVSGCIRGLFVAGEGKDFICSDYSAIEAVVIAALAGEEWRLETFRRKEDIYLKSAEAITGTPMSEYEAYFERTGDKHPDRQKIGKVAELALGYMGWIGAWRNFDSSDTYTDDQVKDTILAWRDASPAIVEMWGGQVRGPAWAPTRYELYGLEGAAIAAILNPGQEFAYRLISYRVEKDVLYCRLPSGRDLAYHNPVLAPSRRWEGQYTITYMGYNTNPKMGPLGWVRMDTYGGKLAENVTQAVSRDIMRDAVNLAERRGYPCVLRVHDELVAEVPKGFGSIEEFEEIMGTLPDWAKDWPVRASGGWRGDRYRKD